MASVLQRVLHRHDDAALAAQHDLRQSLGQTFRGHRLADEGVHSGVEDVSDLVLEHMRRHGDDRQFFEGGTVEIANASGRLHPIHARQGNVHEHDIDRPVLDRLDRLFSGAHHGHLVAHVIRENPSTTMALISLSSTTSTDRTPSSG